MRPNGEHALRLSKIGPGLLLAATGVGAGDLATGSIVGSLLGTAVLWAVLLGAFLKFVATEGLARWQLATGQTLIEGVATRVSPIVLWLFLPYLLVWSFFVAAALMGACGVTLHAMLPLFNDARDGKVVFGMLCSLIGLALVRAGGYRLFERVMQLCIGVMFVTVVVTAALLWPGTKEVLQGLLIPRIPHAGGQGLSWTVALIGGVGGTLTVLCYGYWMREEGRSQAADLSTCRVDLAVGYLMTALFGIAMVIIGNSVHVEGSGARLLVVLSDRLGDLLGPTGKWLFLAGSFGAVFSSLLGVWQAVPYLFADGWRLSRRHSADDDNTHTTDTVDTAGPAYRLYLYALALIPMLGLLQNFREMQKLYAIVGASFFPLLALALLVFNGRTDWVTRRFVNRPATVVVLLAFFAFFTWLAFDSTAGLH